MISQSGGLVGSKLKCWDCLVGSQPQRTTAIMVLAVWLAHDGAGWVWASATIMLSEPIPHLWTPPHGPVGSMSRASLTAPFEQASLAQTSTYQMHLFILG